MKTICVFCGSSIGAKPEYLRAAEELGKCLVKNNITLVYGGSRIGLMGRIAAVVLENCGHAIGVIPRNLFESDIAKNNLTEMYLTDSMHERKALMSSLSDGFIALPGGLGTLEEIFEMMTWAQLGLHRKPCGLLNAAGYFDRLLFFLEHCVKEKFIEPVNKNALIVEKEPDEILHKFMSFKAPDVNMVKWALDNQ